MTLRQCRSRAGVLGNLMSEASGRWRGHLTAHGKSKGTRDCNFLCEKLKKYSLHTFSKYSGNLMSQDCQVFGILPFETASNKARTHINPREGLK